MYLFFPEKFHQKFVNETAPLRSMKLCANPMINELSSKLSQYCGSVNQSTMHLGIRLGLLKKIQWMGFICAKAIVTGCFDVMCNIHGNFHCIRQEERQVFLRPLIKRELFFTEDSWVGKMHFSLYLLYLLYIFFIYSLYLYIFIYTWKCLFLHYHLNWLVWWTIQL